MTRAPILIAVISLFLTACVSDTGTKTSSKPGVNNEQAKENNLHSGLHKLIPSKSVAVLQKQENTDTGTEMHRQDDQQLIIETIDADTSLNRVPDHYYALQVAAISSMDSAENFVEAQDLEPAAIIRTETAKGTVYVVVIGYQASKELSLKAAEYYKSAYGGESWSRRVFDLKAASLP